MSQWGVEITIKGARFVPIVAAPPWAVRQPSHTVEDVILIHIPKKMSDACKVRNALIKIYVGQEYRGWLYLADNLKKVEEVL